MKAIYLDSFTENYASLGKTGEIATFDGGDAFWSLSGEKLDSIGKDWLVTEFDFDSDWRSWEMHPNGEEIVYTLTGSVDLILERDGDHHTIEIRGKGLVVIPRGTWHTAKVHEPSKMLIITRGTGTETRPVVD